MKAKPNQKPTKPLKHAEVDYQRENQQEPNTSPKRADLKHADQKRNDQQQYHAGGNPHDPQRPNQARINANDPTAGDLDQVSESDDAPFNKTYGQQE